MEKAFAEREKNFSESVDNLAKQGDTFKIFHDALDIIRKEQDGDEQGNAAIDSMIDIVKKQARESMCKTIFAIRDILISSDTDDIKVSNIRLLLLKNISSMADETGKKDPEEYGIDSTKFALAGRKKMIEFINTLKHIQETSSKLKIFSTILANESITNENKIVKMTNALLTIDIKFQF